MTEEEAREALFKLNQEYMSHTPKERLKLYESYRAEREKIMFELKRNKLAEKGIELKKK